MSGVRLRLWSTEDPISSHETRNRVLSDDDLRHPSLFPYFSRRLYGWVKNVN